MINHTPVIPRQPTRLTSTNSWNQQAGIRCKYLSGNNLPRIKLIRSKFSQTDIYYLWLLVDFDRVCCSLSRWWSRDYMCEPWQWNLIYTIWYMLYVDLWPFTQVSDCAINYWLSWAIQDLLVPLGTKLSPNRCIILYWWLDWLNIIIMYIDIIELKLT